MLGARGRWKASSTLYPGGVLKFSVVKLSAAQLQVMNSVGILGVVPDPGAGKIVVVDALTFAFTFGTVQYTGGGAVTLQYHGTTTNVLSSSVAAASIQGNANFIAHFDAANTASGIVVPTSHVGLDLVAATADFAAGDGTAKLFITHRVLTL